MDEPILKSGQWPNIAIDPRTGRHAATGEEIERGGQLMDKSIELNPIYVYDDSMWPVLITATYDDSDVVRFYAPDGGTDMPNVRAAAKDELVRLMHNMLLLYERNLAERGVVLNPIDWERKMREAGVEVDA